MVRDGQRVSAFAVDASIADLKRPLARQDVRVEAVNPDACVEARPGMGFDDGPPEDHIPADAAVVGALRRWIPILGAPERLLAFEPGVLLLEAYPGFFCRSPCLQKAAQASSGIGRVRRYVSVEDFAQHKRMPLAPQWVFETTDWPQQQVRIVSA